MNRMNLGLLILGLVLVTVGGYQGLFVAPTEAFMGDVYRILYVHVPAAWVGMLAFVVTFVASTVYLFKSSLASDAIAEASAEVGVFFGALLLISGAIWGRPTWGVWWTWDPRLTTAAIMFFAYAGYLAMRHAIDDPDKRATRSAVVAIIISVDLPIVWYSVKWWNSLHQVQSTSKSMSGAMQLAMWLNVAAYAVFLVLFIRLRYAIARQRMAVESAEPPDLEPAGATPTPAEEGAS